MKVARDSDLMTGDRSKEIVRHLSEDDLDRLLAETDDDQISRRLIFLKRIYKGATLENAADDVGRSSATGARWARRWNEGGLGLLTPSKNTSSNSFEMANRGKTGDSAPHQRGIRC